MANDKILNPFELIDLRFNKIENLLLQLHAIEHDKRIMPVIQDIVEIDEACKITKYKTPTIYLFCRNNQIPHIKKGRKLLFSRKALEEWINSGTKETLSSIQRKA